jgi:hypothetical protein
MHSVGVVIWELFTQEIPWGDMVDAAIIGFVGYENKRLSIPSNAPDLLKVISLRHSLSYSYLFSPFYRRYCKDAGLLIPLLAHLLMSFCKDYIICNHKGESSVYPYGLLLPLPPSSLISFLPSLPLPLSHTSRKKGGGSARPRISEKKSECGGRMWEVKGSEGVSGVERGGMMGPRTCVVPWCDSGV